MVRCGTTRLDGTLIVSLFRLLDNFLLFLNFCFVIVRLIVELLSFAGDQPGSHLCVYLNSTCYHVIITLIVSTTTRRGWLWVFTRLLPYEVARHSYPQITTEEGLVPLSIFGFACSFYLRQDIMI